MKTVFFRILEADDKAASLREVIAHPEAARGIQRFEVDVASFAAVPRSPFAYWLSEPLRRLFVEVPSFEASGRGQSEHPRTMTFDIFGSQPKYCPPR